MSSIGAAALSVLIPTKNEALNVRKCLESVSWAGEVYVVDSSSTDGTQEIAAKMGAKIVNFQWDGRGPRKKNWALANLAWRYEWVLVVDADEEVTPELRDEIQNVIAGQDTLSGFRVPYHYYFLGRFLKHGEPIRKLILFKHRLTRFEVIEVPEVTQYDVELHEQPLVDGAVGQLRNHMLHRDWRNLHEYIKRHNIYSDWEALLRTRYRERGRRAEIKAKVTGSNEQRRRYLKQMLLRIPGKPFVYFLYAYVFKRGFLDGRPGLIFSIFKAINLYQISTKIYEIKLRERGLV